MREISFPRDTISNGAIDLYKGRIAELIGHQDRMDEPRRKVRVSDDDAVPYVGPRGGIRPMILVGFRDDVCEDGDTEETLIDLIDGRREEDHLPEPDADEDDVPMFVGGIPLEEYLDAQDADEPELPMTEHETELFGIVATLMGLETAEVAYAEDSLLALVLVLDEVTSPSPEPATEIVSRRLAPLTAAEGAKILEQTWPFNVLCGTMDDDLQDLVDFDDVPDSFVRLARERDAEDPGTRRRMRRYGQN